MGTALSLAPRTPRAHGPRTKVRYGLGTYCPAHSAPRARALLAPQVQPTNVALIAVGLLVTWPPAAYALILLAGAGALLLDQDHAPSAATASLAAAERRRSVQGRRRSLQVRGRVRRRVSFRVGVRLVAGLP